jgi:hypothetical protein
MGVIRLEFAPAFPNGLGGSSSMQISRLAASESDLYMLSAEEGKILHASFTGRSLDLDNAFNCQPGSYGGYQVGKLIDIIALPKVNASTTVLELMQAAIYCIAHQTRFLRLFPCRLPQYQLGQITAIALIAAICMFSMRSLVWVLVGRLLHETPYFYFSNGFLNIDND